MPLVYYRMLVPLFRWFEPRQLHVVFMRKSPHPLIEVSPNFCGSPALRVTKAVNIKKCWNNN
jgi:hypothetical protein